MTEHPWDGWILALDTGSPVTSVALGRAGTVAARRAAEQPRASSHLVTMIAQTLEEAGVERAALGAVVALRGPGSFTGLRIGLATALGLSQALALPATAVPTLPLLASLDGTDGRVLGAVRGLRGAWFLADRGSEDWFQRHESELASLAPATIVGFGLPPGLDGIRALEPGPLAPALLPYLAARRPPFEPSLLLEPLYLGSSVVAIHEERDPARLVGLETASFAAPWNERQLREALAQADSLTLVAAEHGAPAAYAHFRRVGGDEAELLRVAVLPAARRRGLGRRLLDQGLAKLAAHGARTCFLEVKVTNAAALALYERLGFERCGLRRAYYPDGGDAVLMRRTAR